MKLKTLSILLFFLSSFNNGLKSQTNISGVINSYTKVTHITPSVCTDSITVNSTTGFNVGDSVLIIQMQGALIDTSNTILFGIINSFQSAGNFEFLKIASLTGNNIRFTSSLKRSYSVNDNVQLITKPVYTNATVTGTLSALPWNGSIGGILTFSVTNNLILNANIDLTGSGFRGGNASPNFYSTWFYEFCFGNSPGRGGQKGEGIAQYITNKEYGRGASANGGGGGNDINTGGAGGGNFGNGGHGGNNFFSPDTLWGLRGRNVLNGINQTKLFLGGGGGGGHQNNSQGTSGSNGGGIILIYANTITGNSNTIKSNGSDVIPNAGIDGAGGAGAGGSILIDALTYNSNLFVEAKGGKGGNQYYPPQCHGNGGGGGGGVIASTGSTFPANVITNANGGLQGLGQCNNSVLDAAIGETGGILNNFQYNENISLTSTPDVMCFGSHDGSASILVNGNPPYQYLWTLPNGTTLSSSSISHLSAGNYSLDIINGNGCIATRYFNINQPSPIIITTSSTNAGCNSPTGSVFASATGGTGLLNYSWNTSPIQNNQSATNLAPGTYTVTTTDSHNCSSTNTATILNSAPITFTIDQTPASCQSNNGTVTVGHSGGVGGFSYHWTPPNDTTLASIGGLPPGLYSVTAYDLGTGCSQSLSIIVANSAGISAAVTNIQDATCQTGEDGSATVIAIGGTPPHSYLWPNGDTTATTNTLEPGTYTVMVEDYLGCRAYAVATISYEFSSPAIELGPDTLPCIGTPYTMDAGPGYSSYLWNDNSSNQTLSVTTSGMYSVLVTDSNGCEGFDAINVNFIICASPFPKPLSLSVSEIEIFPNPVGDELTVYFKQNISGETNVTILDLLGKTLQAKKDYSENKKTIKINFRERASGIYFLKIEVENESIILKVIKN